MSTPRRAHRMSEENRASRLMATLAVKILACGLSIFVLLAIVAPVLVDMRRDLALAGAFLSVLLALAIAVFGARAVLTDSRKIAKARRQRLLPPL